MRPYVVRQGEHLSKIAHEQGFDAAKVWQDPKNADLRKLRKDPQILCAGDVLYVPDSVERRTLRFEQGTNNSFVATVPKVTLTIKFLDRGQPVAGAACTIAELPDMTGLATDGGGVLTVKVPVTTQIVTVSIPSVPLVKRLRVGHLDPLETRSGVIHRLRNLGFLGHSGSDDADDAAFTEAVRNFQRAKGLPVTGVLDARTLDALRGEHGC